MTIPRVLTIAGSDSSGAAGAQADLKTFEARGVFGMSALTVITAQNTLGIQASQLLPLDLIEAQIDSVLVDIGADAIKTGMLLSADIIQIVVRKAKQYQPRHLVVDPVMVYGTGKRLVDPSADRAYIDELFPLASVITPNLNEAALLAGFPVTTLEEMHDAARTLLAMGPRHVLVKGGHLAAGDDVIDLLYGPDGFLELRAPRQPKVNARGTGCTFASCIAAELAKGGTMRDAVTIAKNYVTNALRAANGWALGDGRGAVYHGFALAAAPGAAIPTSR